MLNPATLNFLKDLRNNNHKEWFDENRKLYESAKSDFLYFVQQVIDEFSKIDNSFQFVKAKDCIFRINRDIRFSNDKSPYKTNFGAFITKNGKKPMNLAGYYFHLEPGNSFAGGGIYMPMPPELKKIRAAIDVNFPEFLQIIQNKKFKNVFSGLDIEPELMLTRVPKGFETDNPAAEYLKFKSFTAVVNLSDEQLQSNNLLSKTIEIFAALKPLNDFLNNALK